MTHADAVREAERAVLERVKAWHDADAAQWGRVDAELNDAARLWRALVAQTCDQCGGSGVEVLAAYEGSCPRCDNGKRKENAND